MRLYLGLELILPLQLLLVGEDILSTACLLLLEPGLPAIEKPWLYFAGQVVFGCLVLDALQIIKELVGLLFRLTPLG